MPHIPNCVPGTPMGADKNTTKEKRRKEKTLRKALRYSVDKGLSSQNYSSSSSHVWMWELDYEESWAPKNWCFWTVVLGKTLESSLDCKEIKPIIKEINTEYSLEGLMLKLKLQYSGYLMWRTNSLEKALILGMLEGERRRGQLPGASVRNSALGKGHEEGGFGIRKGGIKPQETPCSRASTPKTRVCLLYCFMLSLTPLTLWGALLHHFSWKKS